MQIKAAIARVKSAPLSLETVEVEDPRPGEILVRVHATGICHTDLAMRDQVFPVPQPIVLGHEGAGVVTALGAGVKNIAIGDHVVMSFTSNGCGECLSCADGAPNYCAKQFQMDFAGGRLDGSTALRKGSEKIHSNFLGQSSFAEYLVTNARNAVRVPKDLPLEVLAPLGCGVMTGSGAVMNILQVQKGQSIAVFGTGALGMSALLAARYSGAGVIIAIDVVDSRLQLARELGATQAINAAQGNVDQAIRAIVPGGVRFVVDTTAKAAVIQTAIASLGTRGVCALLGVSPPTENLTLNLIDAVSNGKTVRGTLGGDGNAAAFIPKLIELYRKGQFPYDRLIQYYPFDKINEAIHDSETGKVIKAVLRMPVN